MKKAINVTVNGVTHQSEIEPRTLLVHYIRDVLNLTGTHVGCETSLCGACTVLVDGQAVKSCTMLAAQADGSTVTTIEGLARVENCIRCRRASGNTTDCNAAFALPA